MGGTKSGKESETLAVEDATPTAIPEADGLDEPVGDTGDKDPVSPVC